MRLVFRPSLGLFLALLMLPLAGQAQAPNDGTLRILRPVIHAEQDKAELCLEFDRPLDTGDRNRTGGNIRLESNGKNIALAPQNFSLISSTLCLAGLDHHRDYRVTVSGLRGAANEKLAEPYHLSFSVPDRQSALAFAGDGRADGLMRWQDSDPVLRAINVTRARLELYRIRDTARMAEAWRQRLQTTLAPSESAYFARHNGELLWQGEIVMGDTPNTSLEQKVPLHALIGDPARGLYFIVASATETKNKAAKGDLASLAGAWLLRSDLNLHALRANDGYYALTEKTGAPSIAKDVHLTLEDDSLQSLAEGKSDGDGIAFLPLAADKLNSATVLVGTTEAGDIDFADLTQNGETGFVLPDTESSVATGKPFYVPDAHADITLTARDRHGRSRMPADSRLQILRPDHSLYAILPVPKDQDGIAHLSFPVPAGNGLWPLLWQQTDGRVLAEGRLRITANDDAPRLEISVDRPVLAADGAVDLKLKSLTLSGKPAPYISGQIAVGWDAPDHIFSGREDYHFGDGDTRTLAAKPVAAFITDENGVAQVHLNLALPNDGSVLHEALIGAQSDPAAGAADPAPLALPVRPNDVLIGMKPAAPDGKFAENSVAHFDVVALDADGKRQNIDGLTYQIYEEGRSFDWYQAEGRWDYKPLQQRRRVGGGTLAVKADGGNGIDWPVTAGTYRLEIADANGAVRARLGFSAGWGGSKNEVAAPALLALTATPPVLQAGQAAKVHFRLDQPAVISAVIADDRIRKVIHQLKPSGDNEIAFTPEESWGDSIGVRIETAGQIDGNPVRFAGKIILPLPHAMQKTNDAAKTPAVAAPQEAPPAFAITGATPPVLKTGDMAEFTISLKNNAAPSGSYRYTLNSPSGLKITGAVSGAVSLAAGQSRDLSFTVSTLQAGDKEIRLDITGPHNLHLNSGWTLAVVNAGMELADQPAQSIAPQQTWALAARDKGHAHTETGYLFLAPQPLLDVPQILSAALQAHAFTSRESAAELETLRLWHDLIVPTELLSEQKFLSRRHAIVMRLLSRQKPDGGFPPLPGEEADIASTASVLTALGRIDNPLAKRASDAAADWLRHKTENNWFDESERPARAAAYAALAATGHLDASSLHYFSDTSADKSLPPLAAAQLAAAFATLNDRDAAAFWLSAAHIDPTADIEAALLPLLAENTDFDAQSLLPALEKLSGEIIRKSSSGFEAITAFLRAAWHLQDRAGIWRVTVNNSEQNLKNILAVALPEKTAALAVRNPNDRPLFLVEAEAAKIPSANDAGIVRRIYRMDGGETPDATLRRDETYLIVLEGSWFGDNADPVLVRDYVGPALRPVSCVLGGSLNASDSLAWLRGFLLTPVTLCEKTGETIDVLIDRKNTDAKTWRVAYLAKPEWGGTFTLTPASLRSMGEAPRTAQGRADQIHIQ